MDRAIRICTIPGDGIGPEVVASACDVLRGLSDVQGTIEFEFYERPAGYAAFTATGSSLPDETLAAAQAADCVLVGAMDVARLPSGVLQPLRGLRRGLGISASIRPVRSYPGESTPDRDTVDVLTVRELTEGLYAGIEYPVGDSAACAVRVVTTHASGQIARIAFTEATKRRGKVTAVHKLGALKLTDSVFLDAVEDVARDYPSVEFETRNVDACAMELVLAPGEFDVILATNAFGDILSDVAAGLTGGLGLAPSGCVGERGAYFEPVHGSAPDIAGEGVANPIATIRSAAMMLRHLGETSSARAVELAVDDAVLSGQVKTRDMGGSTNTVDATARIVAGLPEAMDKHETERHG